MDHILLTGSTGLLGGYLLRDLLCREQKVAVLVRPSRLETAEQRIEQSLLFWEEQWGRSLPRPVVFSGEITEPQLGLDRDQLAWVRRHCTSVVHSAASLLFHAKGDEPDCTNIGGTRNVLDFCHETGVAELSYISTAYISGCRHGVVLESEVDVGQELANDYERSKLAAEQLVRSDTRLRAYTIFRPSIIVGDYHSGFTSTYHGFYAPLRIAFALATMIRAEQLLDVNFLQLLGLHGDERKNFVPVDWVSDAIATIFARRPAENQTYALVSQQPVTATRLLSVFEETVRRYLASTSGNGESLEFSGSAETEVFEQAYIDQFENYRTYWRDDPQFDCTNTLSVLGDRPCPEMTDEVMLRQCDYAVASRFGWPRRILPLPEFCARDWLRASGGYAGWTSVETASDSLRKDNDPVVLSAQLMITGMGGGCWTICSRRKAGLSCHESAEISNTRVRMNSQTFQELLSGDLTLEQAVHRARVIVYGSSQGLSCVAGFLQAARRGVSDGEMALGPQTGHSTATCAL